MSKVFTIAEGLENMGALRTGGQGSVYKGRRVGHIMTAVKLIPTPIYHESADDKNFRRFQNEVEKLKKVNQEPNPNVVKILSSGLTESGSFPFIEMEYIEGPDLEELLQPPHDKIFTIKEAIKVADQLACALSHCHKVGVKHGDIKSNNVKFNIHSGNYVLLDFGLAIMSDEQRRSSVRNAGAIEFMAPEQNDGQMLFQTDIYSYGVVMFELLAGQVPFPLTDNSENARNTVRLKHIEEMPPDLLSLRQRNLPATWSDEKKATEMLVPDWLVRLINTCLAKKPESRYADGIALHDAINKSSISGATNGELQAENERLRALLYDPIAKNAAMEDQSSNVQISKPLFILMIILLVSSMAMAGYYTLFYKNNHVDPNKNSTFTDSVRSDTANKTNSIGDNGVPLGQNPVNQNPDSTNDTQKIKPAKQQLDNVPDTSIKPQTDTTNTTPVNPEQGDTNNDQTQALQTSSEL